MTQMEFIIEIQEQLINRKFIIFYQIERSKEKHYMIISKDTLKNTFGQKSIIILDQEKKPSIK